MVLEKRSRKNFAGFFFSRGPLALSSHTGYRAHMGDGAWGSPEAKKGQKKRPPKGP